MYYGLDYSFLLVSTLGSSASSLAKQDFSENKNLILICWYHSTKNVRMLVRNFSSFFPRDCCISMASHRPPTLISSTSVKFSRNLIKSCCISRLEDCLFVGFLMAGSKHIEYD